MPVRTIGDVEKLKRINDALMARVEKSMDQQGNAFSLFQTAINLEGQVRRRTDELTVTLRSLEKSNNELVKAKEVAEQANASKTRFLAAASHDVLQPLNAAHLSLSALANLLSTDEQRSLARQVEQSLDAMDDLLRTLLEISKLDAGVMQPRIGEVALDGIMETLLSGFRSAATAKGIELRVMPMRHSVVSDRQMLRRILQNLISNALRYTRRGGVLIGARRRGGDLRLEIVDTGKGIPAEEFESVFEEFHSLSHPDDSADGERGGFGLGLAIVRRMVFALNHRLELHSTLGRGTSFRLYLPIASRQAPADHYRTVRHLPAENAGLGEKQVMLIENDTAVMAAMAALLKSWGCSCRLANSTGEALELVRESGWRPDILVADQHLDYGDLGTVTIRMLREALGARIPAIIITADPSPELREKADEAEIELMRKPVKPAQLRALMTHLVRP